MCEHQRPSPAVGALEAGVVGEVGGLGYQRLGGQVFVEHLAYVAGGQRVRCLAQQPHQRPVHLDAGVPVVAAVERGVDLARCGPVIGASHRVAQVVWVFLLNGPHDGRRIHAGDAMQHSEPLVLVHTLCTIRQ